MLDTEPDNAEQLNNEPAGSGEPSPERSATAQDVPRVPAVNFQPPQAIFQPPTVASAAGDGEHVVAQEPHPDEEGAGAGRRRRRRGGRGRGKGGDGAGTAEEADSDTDGEAAGHADTARSAAPPKRAASSKKVDDSRSGGSSRSRRRSEGGTQSAHKGGNATDKDVTAAGTATADTARAGAAKAGTARAATAKAATAQAGTAKAGAAAAAGGANEDGADAYGDGADVDPGVPAPAGADQPEAIDPGTEAESAATRRRRRRRRRGSGGDAEPEGADDPPNTVVHVREPRAAAASDWTEVQSVKGSTRLEAKKQRRREGRDSGRRRPPLLSESEFLARREAVHRVMLVRQRSERTQIAVLEDGVLVEHYVDRASHQSMAGNIYLGKVQNVLPSMEAAFVDIGKGRNAVLYAGEINFDASGLEGQPKRIEMVLKSGQSVLVQVTKDPVGHKGARLTNQVSLPGRYLVYVPGASMTGISRKLPATERARLKQILKKVTPEDAGVIVRTAAEGTGEEELARDVARLAAQWENIQQKAQSASPPELLYSEPDVTIRVVRDIFNEDFSELVVAGDEGWDVVNEYVRWVAPHLAERVRQWQDDADMFASYRVDEQIAKALDRKVWLPSGGSLVVDRTEAMTVIDVNTGKFTGQGGNLEETVTRNNLEAAEEIVRQLRLRDIGGIIVIDFIDMVLESNRELVLRRLLECLARDRTKHQVAEVTSLGLVQMTRKRVGSGLLEAFSEPCECCNGRGVVVSFDLLEPPTTKRAASGRSSGKGEANSRAKATSGAEGKGGGATSKSRATSVAADETGRAGRRRAGHDSGADGRDTGAGRDAGADGDSVERAAKVGSDARPAEDKAEEKRSGRRRRRRAAPAASVGASAQPAGVEPDTGVTDPGSGVSDPGSGVSDPGPRVTDPGSGVSDPGRPGADVAGSAASGTRNGPQAPSGSAAVTPGAAGAGSSPGEAS